MAEHIKVPVIEYGGHRWGALAYYGKDHEITGENQSCVDQKYSFKGGHRVRIYRMKKSVYWKLPSSITVDISEVTTRRAPPQR